MAVYVVVSDTPYEKAIMAGPYELEDPSQFPTQLGTHLMLESEALANGYQYAPDGAFAPGQSTKSSKGEDNDQGGRKKRRKHSKGHN
ncbi:hypothetical protein [Streptomyces sp. NPDC059080]|uniref:hypothetical protein n=1 Tax=Streptomyces sp. NPDC059080 TaxID=3346718 RepID=UPI00368A904B